jgi:Domain of unknown function (DUF5666)
MKEQVRPAVPVLIVSMALLLAGGAVAGFAQAAKPVFIDGTVTSMTATQITLTAPDGSTKNVTLPPGTLALERQNATLSDIKRGDAMGVTAHRAEDGTMTATIINIFPAQLYKVVQKGQFPMQQPGQIMTNAVVSAFVAKGSTHALTMKYGSESFPIVVPEGAEVHRLVPVSLSLVKTGMHILVRGSPNADGSLTAATVMFDQG